MSAKNLIASFEKGEIVQNDLEPRSPTERVGSRPGVTKKLVSEYEGKGKEKPQSEVTRVLKKHLAEGVAEEGVKLGEEPKLNILIVFCHMERKSFNGTMLDAAMEQLTAQGHKVVVSDLYDMNFNPVPSKNDIKGEPENKEKFHYAYETLKAFEKGEIADDIAAEQAKVMAADVIILQFPVHWGSYPTMLKGWIDRVLCEGFAYGGEHTLDDGKLKDKRILLSLTVGGPEGCYTTSGILGDINVMLWSMQYMALRFVGLQILPPHVVYGVNHVMMSQELANQRVAEWKTRLRTLSLDVPLRFIHKRHFSHNFELDQEMVEAFSGMEFGPSVGHNLGKPHHPQNMLKSGVDILVDKLKETDADAHY